MLGEKVTDYINPVFSFALRVTINKIRSHIEFSIS